MTGRISVPRGRRRRGKIRNYLCTLVLLLCHVQGGWQPGPADWPGGEGGEEGGPQISSCGGCRARGKDARDIQTEPPRQTGRQREPHLSDRQLTE